MNQIGLSGKYICSEKKNFLHDPIWPWPLTFKLHSMSLHTLWPKALCGWARLDSPTAYLISIFSPKILGEKICYRQGFSIIIFLYNLYKVITILAYLSKSSMARYFASRAIFSFSAAYIMVSTAFSCLNNPLKNSK